MEDCNIAQVLRDVAQRQPEQEAIVARERGRWRATTFSELLQAVDFFAGFLHAQGVERGDRVMLMVRPSMEFMALTFALFQLGAVVILIDPGMGYRNLLKCIGTVQPAVLVGIEKAVWLSRLVRTPFRSVRLRVCVNRALVARARHASRSHLEVPKFVADTDALAAIIFTTGSTGPPKGVEYTHGIFQTQLNFIREYYLIGSEDVDQPGFPLFGLFATALGAKAVIPDMDPTRPAQVNPHKFVASLQEHQVSYSFGSPAIWNVVSRYCLEQGIRVPVKKVLMAGAPVPGELVERVRRILPADSQIFTPYGATETLPVASIEGKEIVEHTWAYTRKGEGTCVGRALPGMKIAIIAPVAGPIAHWQDVSLLQTGEIGEIVVQGPVVTRAYANNPEETRQAKIQDEGGFWHRMGDMGYLDTEGRLWFCGRKAHCVHAVHGVMYTIRCEAVFNEHPLVRRSALVGVGSVGQQVPVMVIEPQGPISNRDELFTDLRHLAVGNRETAPIEHFLLHRSFPVDIRHNAKIFREKLAEWARKQLQLPCG